MSCYENVSIYDGKVNDCKGDIQLHSLCVRRASDDYFDFGKILCNPPATKCSSMGEYHTTTPQVTATKHLLHFHVKS